MGLLDIAICTTGSNPWLRHSVEAALREVTQADFKGNVWVLVNGGNINKALPSCAKVERVENIGLSNARNRAFALSDAQYIAFVDDDAVMREGWGIAVRQLLNNPSSFGIAGGPVKAIWEPPNSDVSRWPESVLRYISTDFDIHGATTIVRTAVVMGANMIVSRKAHAQIGGFDSAVGRYPRKPLGMEEMVFIARARQLGFSVLFHPQMIVDHHVSIERLRLLRVVRRYWYEGVSWRLCGSMQRRQAILRLYQILMSNLASRWESKPPFYMPKWCEVVFLGGVLLGKP